MGRTYVSYVNRVISLSPSDTFLKRILKVPEAEKFMKDSKPDPLGCRQPDNGPDLPPTKKKTSR